MVDGGTTRRLPRGDRVAARGPARRRADRDPARARRLGPQLRAAATRPPPPDHDPVRQPGPYRTRATDLLLLHEYARAPVQRRAGAAGGQLRPGPGGPGAHLPRRAGLPGSAAANARLPPLLP